MPEGVELPGRGRVATHHVALVADAVDQIADRGLGRSEVGVGLVVGASHQFQTSLVEQLSDVGAILGMCVPIGLEVVELRQNEGVVGISAGGIEVSGDQREAGRLEPRLPFPGALDPGLGIGGLRVPPHRVVVEVGNHEDCPARLLDHHVDLMSPTRFEHHLGGKRLARTRRRIDRDRDLDHDLFAITGGHLDRFSHGDLVTLDPQQGRSAARLGQRDSDHLKRPVGAPGEQVSGLGGGDPHRASLVIDPARPSSRTIAGTWTFSKAAPTG